MRTRSQTRNRNRRQQQQTLPVVVEPCNLEEPIPGQTIVAMADRTMEELLRAPTEGYREAIVLPEINADHFEIKTNFLQLVQANPNVPNDVIKLMMFPYSLEGAAKTWYEKEPPNSILTWDDLVTKFVNQFFPPSKTTHLKNKISRFSQEFDESFSEAWERFKGMLRSCPHHGFSELTQVDTFYNGLTENEQDSLNAAAGGNLLSKTTREALNIIENKSKVRYSRNKTNASRVNSRENVSKTDERIDKLADQLSTLVEIVSKKVVVPPAPVKAVEENCVTCGGAHAWYNCPATDNNQNVCATTGTYNQQAPPNRVSNQMAPPGFAPVQNQGQNRNYNNQGQGNNFNRGNNFQNQGFQGQVNHASNFQNQGFQNQPFQVSNNQVNDFSNDFLNYKKSNDQTIRNLQYQITSMKGELKNEIQNTIKNQQTALMSQNNAFQNTLQNNLQNMLSSFFQAQASPSGTLPSNTIPNPKGEMKAITTRSGVAYEGPSNPTKPSPKKVVERETEEITNEEQNDFQGSTAQIPPPVIPNLIPEPEIPKTLPKSTPILKPEIPKTVPKANIPYPSRRDNQKNREKASYQKEKIFQMFQDLRFDISFADALFLMPRFAPTIRASRKAVLTLVERVKSLEVALKRKTKKVVVSDSEYEETENQGRKIQDIDDDPLVSLVRESMKKADFVTPIKDSALGEAQEEEISPTILEAAKTLSQVASQTVSTYKRRVRSTDNGKDISTGLDVEVEVNTGSEDFNPDSIEVNTGSAPVSTPSVVQTVNVVIPSPVKSQREGKTPMTTEETQATKRTRA
ncbi:reverse transcriptase domain-containing protein [Tanacetum coccineum]|uniref:Reverse transcriptase domain-containing protein n=1 Tax=Tanacetum coccineum TaxID=301880 RepID=A0ABQ5AIF4_9ASTR